MCACVQFNSQASTSCDFCLAHKPSSVLAVHFFIDNYRLLYRDYRNKSIYLEANFGDAIDKRMVYSFDHL